MSPIIVCGKQSATKDEIQPTRQNRPLDFSPPFTEAVAKRSSARESTQATYFSNQKTTNKAKQVPGGG